MENPEHSSAFYFSIKIHRGWWSIGTLMWPMVDGTLHLRHQVRSWACQVIMTALVTL